MSEYRGVLGETFKSGWPMLETGSHIVDCTFSSRLVLQVGDSGRWRRACVRSYCKEDRDIDKGGMWPLLLGRPGLWLKSQILECCWNPSPLRYQIVFQHTSLEAYPHHHQGEAEWRFFRFLSLCRWSDANKRCLNLMLTDVALHP